MRTALRTLVLGLGASGVLACNALAGIEEKPCIPACVDDQTRLVCQQGRAPRAERCPESSEVCALTACEAGQCGFRPAVGKTCGQDDLGTCNAGYACMGPDMQLSAMVDHTCLVAADGKVWCWGTNQFGELGDGTTEERGTPVVVQNLPGRALQVSVGYQHVCALLEDFHVYCWGDNSQWQCGTEKGPTLKAPTLVRVSGASGTFTRVQAGALHTCAITTDQRVSCWGNSTGGQCGVDPKISNEVTVSPSLISNFDELDGPHLDEVVDIETVKAHTCARRSTPPTLVCWGSNTYLQRNRLSYALGPAAADLEYSARPIPIDLGQDVVDIGMGFESTYAVTLHGQIFAWGWNERGQLGVESTERFVPNPAPVVVDLGEGPQPLIGASEVLRTDGSHQCARMAGPVARDASSPLGSPYLCWGANDYGELGFGESSMAHQIFRFATPASILPAGARNLVHGQDHACFLLTADAETQVYCYGKGQCVGNGTIGPDAPDQWKPKPIAWDAASFVPPLANNPPQ